MRVWSIDGATEAVVMRFDPALGTVAFSPGGTRSMTVSNDMNVRIWTLFDAVAPSASVIDEKPEKPRL